MKWKLSEEVRDRIAAYTISGLIIAAVMLVFFNWPSISVFLKRIFTALSPFIWGLCFTFILIPVRNVLESRVLANTNLTPRHQRIIAVVISILLLLAFIIVFLVLLIPQLYNSISLLLNSMDSYINTVNGWLNQLHASGQYSAMVSNLSDSLRKMLEGILTGSNGILNRLVNYSVTFVKGISNFFIGLIISVYILLDQERWTKQIRKLTFAFLPAEAAENLSHICSLIGGMLNKFVFGKSLDSLIIGVVTGICCGIMRMPYSLLIAFVIGITNMIPVFGPFIGAVPCLFILLLISPIKALEFGIFVLILQQIDGNILGPYILGDSMGLPALWIMFAIILGGSLFGILGMFLGIPIFSVFYVLLRDFANRKIREKRVKV
ncbi:MAG: AI-2E family transporter [Solobacterium sp.]|nr:AI-2E family transporter [Solobacterium sp.]